MIELIDFSVLRNARKVINSLGYTFTEHSITAIVGANGSGKSTLLAALSGDIPYSGSAKIDGSEINELTIIEQAELRSVVLQNHQYWLTFSTQEVLEMGLSKQAISNLERYVKELEIDDFLAQPITTLSGGQLQRVEIARALARDSKILLLDEPLSAQDMQSRLRIIEILKRERNSGKTILVVAHIDSAELSWCDGLLNL